MACKLFLGGLAPTTVKEDIEQHFSSYGTITDAVVMFKDGRPRGFGFVTFAEPEAMDAVLAEEQVIHEKTIDCKAAVGKDQAPPPKDGGVVFAPRSHFGGGGGSPGFGGYQHGFQQGYEQAMQQVQMQQQQWAPPPVSHWAPPSKGFPPRQAPAAQPSRGGSTAGIVTDKVFIGGLRPETTDDTLHEYFGKYGTLVDVVVMKDKVTQKSRGFGFVRYDNTESVEQVIAEYQSHEIDGKWIEVKKAVPQEHMGAPASGGFGKGGGFAPKGGGGYAGGGAQGGGYGAHVLGRVGKGPRPY